MAKTKNISIRLNETDLKFAFEKSKLSKPQKLIDLLLSEYVKPFHPQKPFIDKQGNETDKAGGKPVVVKIDTSYEPTFKNDVERMFWEEDQKLKNK